MEGHKTGFNRPALASSAQQLYAIDLSRYKDMVTEYESLMLDKQNRDYESRKNS